MKLLCWKKYSRTLVKDGKADFIQVPRDSWRDHCNGIFQLWGEIGFHSEYNLSEWECRDKEQVVVSEWKTTKGNLRDRRLLAKQT